MSLFINSSLPTKENFVQQLGISSHSSRCDVLRHVMMTLSSYMQNYYGNANISAAYSEGNKFHTPALFVSAHWLFPLLHESTITDLATVAMSAIHVMLSGTELTLGHQQWDNCSKSETISSKRNMYLAYIHFHEGRKKEIIILAKTNLVVSRGLEGIATTPDLVWVVCDGQGKKLAVMQHHMASNV